MDGTEKQTMSDNLETIREIENIVTDFSNKDIVKVFALLKNAASKERLNGIESLPLVVLTVSPLIAQLSFVNGHDWDYDAGLVRTVLLDMYEKREGVEAAESLRATALDK